MQRLPLIEKIGYGLGDTASNIVFQVVINFMIYFYTDVFGIGAAAVGTLMLVVRLFDAVTDPLMGGLADRTHTRWGQYRPYLLWLAVPYGVLAVLALTTPDLNAGGKLVYAYVTYVLLMTVYTAINIPYSALGGVITTDPQERASVQSWRFVLAMAGGAVVTATTLPLVDLLGGGNEQKGFQLAMAVLAVFAVVCFIGCFLLTNERENPADTASKQGGGGLGVLLASMARDFGSLLKNDQWRIIALITFILLTSIAMRGGSTPYFVEYYLNSKSMISVFLTASMLAGVAGALAANWLSSRYCKVKVMKWAAIGIVVFNDIMGFMPRDQVMLALVVCVFANFVHMIFTPYIFSAVADTVDYSLERSGDGAMAMSYSGHLLALKIGIALGGALTAWILAGTGYQPNAEQTDLALSGIRFNYAWTSVIAGVLLLVLLGRYRLDRQWAESRQADASGVVA